MRFGEGPEKILDVMPDLVGNDIGIGKITRGAELFLHRSEEREVDIDRTVGRTVERSRLGCGASASGLYRAGVKDKGWRFVGPAHSRELFRPNVFGAGKNLLGKACKSFFLFGRDIFRLTGRKLCRTYKSQYIKRIAT